MELVTVKTFDSAIEAHLLRSRFSNEGILSFIFDENIMTLNPLYNIMIGGIKLKVSQADLARAQAILRQLEMTPALDENQNVLTCPACASTRLYSGFKSMKGIAGFLSAVLSLFLGVLPIYFKTVYRCKDCETEFSEIRN